MIDPIEWIKELTAKGWLVLIYYTNNAHKAEPHFMYKVEVNTNNKVGGEAFRETQIWGMTFTSAKKSDFDTLCSLKGVAIGEADKEVVYQKWTNLKEQIKYND